MADPKETAQAVDELEDAIDRNIAEDGELDVVDDEAADAALDTVDEAEEDEELDSKRLDLDSDFDWDYYPQMHPSKRQWPQHDYGVLYQPSAINRYLVDYLTLVARVQQVAKVLDKHNRPL